MCYRRYEETVHSSSVYVYNKNPIYFRGTPVYITLYALIKSSCTFTIDNKKSVRTLWNKLHRLHHHQDRTLITTHPLCLSDKTGGACSSFLKVPPNNRPIVI